MFSRAASRPLPPSFLRKAAALTRAPCWRLVSAQSLRLRDELLLDCRRAGSPGRADGGGCGRLKGALLLEESCPFTALALSLSRSRSPSQCECSSLTPPLRTLQRVLLLLFPRGSALPARLHRTAARSFTRRCRADSRGAHRPSGRLRGFCSALLCVLRDSCGARSVRCSVPSCIGRITQVTRPRPPLLRGGGGGEEREGWSGCWGAGGDK